MYFIANEQIFKNIHSKYSILNFWMVYESNYQRDVMSKCILLFIEHNNKYMYIIVCIKL